MPRAKKPDCQADAFGTPEFKKLRAKWYKTLQDEGFKDLEDGRENMKADTSRRRMESRPAVEKLAREAYYTKATHHLFDTDWTGRQRERIIWGLHCHGMGIRAVIAQTNWSFRLVREAIRAEQVVLAAVPDEPEDEP